MTGRLRRCLVAGLLVAALGTACDGGGTNKDVHPRATDPRRVVAARSGSTTTPSTTAALRQLPAFDGVAPPALLSHGDDHLAITKSLLEYGRWIDRHHPDPALVERAYLAGSALAVAVATDVAKNRLARRHIVEVDRAPSEFVVVSTRADLVSYSVTEHLARRDVIDRHGRVVQHAGPATERYLIVVMRFGPDSPWGLSVVERQGPPIEVQL